MYFDDDVTYPGVHPAEADTDVVLVGVPVDDDQTTHNLTDLGLNQY